MGTHFLSNLVALLGSAFLITALSERFRIPPIVGLLVGGLVLGPAGLGLITEVRAIHLLADLGVVLLLFVLGLEFSVQRLWQLRRIALVGGVLQMGLATVIGVALSPLFTAATLAEALSLGLVICVSSTAVGLRLLQEKAEVTSPHGQIAFSISLAQDVAVAPILVLIRSLGILSHGSSSVGSILRELLTLCGAAIGLFVGLFLLLRLLVPLLRSGSSREAFVLLGVSTGVGAALFAEHIGLSPALGAFAAGLMLSRYNERYRLMSAVEPFRDTFASLFFLSVGLLLTPPLPIGPLLGLSALLFGGKFLAAYFPARLSGYPHRSALLAGLLLASIGEFSIVSLTVASTAGLFSPETQQLLRGAVIVSMLLSTLLYPLARQRVFGRGRYPKVSAEDVLSEHILLIGYGITGKTLHRVLKETGLPYAILELNPFTVAQLRAAGEPALLGDCTDETSLRHAGADRARAVLVAISDTLVVPRAVGLIRTLNPTAFIAARTRFVAHIEPLYAAGASFVVAEEFEASLYLLEVLLRHLGMSPESLMVLQERFRAEHYALFQQQVGESEN